VSDTPLKRGAVGIARTTAAEPQRLIFDRVRVSTALTMERGAERIEVLIDGVDTTRARGQLMLFTPRYHSDTDTAPNGTEWQLAEDDIVGPERPATGRGDEPRMLNGRLLRVAARREGVGKMPIPRDGAVLSYGGTVLPTALETLRVGDAVRLSTRFESETTPPQDWVAAGDIVGGAGLLVRQGRSVGDWTAEKLRPGYEAERHPRTVIGVDRDDLVWLIVVDGRQPQLSIGMTFAELQKLGEALRLQSALNLDGGGSTTMVAQGKIVSHPSDPGGARKVSDALIVTSRQ
jgi:hypothetical protein